jgi:Bacterial archaeo-eukaryotic release factor family 3
MDKSQAQDIRELAAVRRGPHLSLYLPVAPFPQRPHTRLKAALQLAGQRLRESGMSSEEATSFLAPVSRLAGAALEAPQPKGLALFVAGDFARIYRLAQEVGERLEVADRFLLRPLLSLDRSGPFYVLALSINDTRLIEASRQATKRLAVPGLPKDFETEMGYSQYDSAVQVHSSNPAALGRRGGVMHGHGDDDAERWKVDLANYFRRVSSAVRRAVRDPRAVIVLACVAEYLPIYREASGDARVLPQGIPGNPELLSDDTLRERGLALLGPALDPELVRDLNRLEALRSTPRVFEALEEILPAAAEGRVEALLVAKETERWGHFDPAAGTTSVSESRQPQDEELVETMALQTLSHGGRVHFLPAARMPAGRESSAILRY